MSIYTIFTVPVLAFLFLMDKRLFLEPELGEIYGKDMPREGLPAAWSEFFELNALLWGNTSYLYGATESGINFWQFVLVECYAIFQFTMSIVVDPIMFVWSGFSLWTLIVIFAYEFLIVGVTIDDLENELTPEETTAAESTPEIEQEEETA